MMFKKILRRIWYLPQYWFYHYIYIPIWDILDRTKDQHIPMPPTQCQICGEVGHRERYCPNARKLGYFDD